MAVDLKHPDGPEVVLRLVEQADALLEGFRPGVAERLGIGPAPCLARNRRLVYGRMTGWGQEGPLAASAGHDITYAAVAGALAHIGRAGQLPTPPLNLVADFGGGGMLLALGLVAGLLHAERTGEGQVVDAAMVDGTALLMAPFFGARAVGFWSDERGTNLLDSGAPFYDVYRCSDGKEIAVGAIEPQFFAALLEVLGLAPGSLPDQNDRERWPELRAALTWAFEGRPRAEWLERAEGVDACVAPGADDGRGGPASPPPGPADDRRSRRGAPTGTSAPLLRHPDRARSPPGRCGGAHGGGTARLGLLRGGDRVPAAGRRGRLRHI